MGLEPRNIRGERGHVREKLTLWHYLYGPETLIEWTFTAAR